MFYIFRSLPASFDYFVNFLVLGANHFESFCPLHVAKIHLILGVITFIIMKSLSLCVCFLTSSQLSHSLDTQYFIIQSTITITKTTSAVWNFKEKNLKATRIQKHRIIFCSRRTFKLINQLNQV